MKKFLYFFSAILMISVNSYSQSDRKEIKPEGSLIVDPKKALTGSFVDFWSKNDWSQQEWENQTNVEWLRLHADRFIS